MSLVSYLSFKKSEFVTFRIFYIITKYFEVSLGHNVLVCHL